jgi:hypothetical protein
MTQGYSKLRKKSLVKAGIGRGEYQKRVPVGEKLAMLSFLCEHALQSEDSRTEVSVRLMYAHQTIVEPTLQKPGEGDPEWRPQEVKPEGRAQETPLLRKASDRLLKSTEKGEWSKEVQRAATALGGDGNSNDCMICGMDGVLLCCDACPAAYHSRCVGITKSKLSTGDWFCPECRLICRGTPYSKRLQGAQLLGMGPQERYFLATCNYLLVYAPSLFSVYVQEFPILTFNTSHGISECTVTICLFTLSILFICRSWRHQSTLLSNCQPFFSWMEYW